MIQELENICTRASVGNNISVVFFTCPNEVKQALLNELKFEFWIDIVKSAISINTVPGEYNRDHFPEICSNPIIFFHERSIAVVVKFLITGNILVASRTTTTRIYGTQALNNDISLLELFSSTFDSSSKASIHTCLGIKNFILQVMVATKSPVIGARIETNSGPTNFAYKYADSV